MDRSKMSPADPSVPGTELIAASCNVQAFAMT